MNGRAFDWVADTPHRAPRTASSPPLPSHHCPSLPVRHCPTAHLQLIRNPLACGYLRKHAIGTQSVRNQSRAPPPSPVAEPRRRAPPLTPWPNAAAAVLTRNPGAPHLPPTIKRRTSPHVNLADSLHDPARTGGELGFFYRRRRFSGRVRGDRRVGGRPRIGTRTLIRPQPQPNHFRARRSKSNHNHNHTHHHTHTHTHNHNHNHNPIP